MINVSLSLKTNFFRSSIVLILGKVTGDASADGTASATNAAVGCTAAGSTSADTTAADAAVGGTAAGELFKLSISDND